MTGCQVEDDALVNDSIQDNEPLSLKNLQAYNLCGYDINTDIESFYQLNDDDNMSPHVKFLWDYTYDLDCDVVTQAYIQVTDHLAECSTYDFINELYPIDFVGENSLVKDIMHLTDTPHEVYNPFNPPTYTNLIYGSKCFRWRIIISVECPGVGDLTCDKIATKWKYFELTN